MNKTVKQIALFMLIGLLILAIFQVNQSTGNHKFINYSDFIKKVNNQEVGKVTIENNRKITGYYRESPIKQDKPDAGRLGAPAEKYDFETNIPYADQELIKTLLSNNVVIEGRDDDDNFLAERPA